MANALEQINLRLNGGIQHQTIDGFGVNINSKYWDNGRLIPTMNLLIDDLGANLYRVDIYGKSDWVDPQSANDSNVLNEKTYAQVYTSEIFKNGWSMIRYLNERGIEPYLTCSGDVPKWMLGSDGKTLVQYEQFCDMLISLIDWAKNKENIRFKYFGPLNETDIGSPEGPHLMPEGYAQVLLTLDRKLREKGYDDVKLVVAEQAMFNSDYVKEFIKYEQLASRIAVFALHTYEDLSEERYKDVTDVCKNTHFEEHSMWMSEFGDLDQTGEKEWYIGWKSTSRLLDTLKAGFKGALAWDAYDNYHDHDGAWTIYGLLRNARRIFTPKKRYYSLKHVYKYVSTGFVRVETISDGKDVKILAFSNVDRTKITIVGMNMCAKDLNTTIWFDNFDTSIKFQKFSYYRTSEYENCFKVQGCDFVDKTNNNLIERMDLIISAYSIFTITNIE